MLSLCGALLAQPESPPNRRRRDPPPSPLAGPGRRAGGSFTVALPVGGWIGPLLDEAVLETHFLAIHSILILRVFCGVKLVEFHRLVFFSQIHPLLEMRFDDIWG